MLLECIFSEFEWWMFSWLSSAESWKPKWRSLRWGYFSGDLELSAPRGGTQVDTPHLSHLLFLEIRELRVEGEDRTLFFFFFLFSSSTYWSPENQTKNVKSTRLNVSLHPPKQREEAPYPLDHSNRKGRKKSDYDFENDALTTNFEY